MIIGLTGGSGSGKTTVARFFAENGALVIDADIIAREVVEKGSPALDEIQAVFGNDIICKDGTLNRKKLGDIVFSDKFRLILLNKITHKYITTKILNIIEIEEQNYSFIIIDAAVLFESGMDEDCDIVITLTAPEDLRAERISFRDGISMQDALKRINSQMPQREMEMMSDYVINSTGTIEELQKTVQDIVFSLKKGENSVSSSK